MKLFAGYDGGGTKTACVLTDETGRILGFGLGGPSNYLYCGREMAAESVRTATAEAFADADLPMARLDTAYMASAAILIQHGDAHVPFFSTCIDAEHVICESDIYNIWFGAVRDTPAVITIAGTGAITYICSKEGHLRVGGWGPLLGDEGSGYDLGLRALKLACRMYDGREPMEPGFMDAMFRHYAVSTPGELLRLLNQGDMAKATTEGVVLAPSGFVITMGSPPSNTATQELVVPKSIPIIFPIFISSKNSFIVYYKSRDLFFSLYANIS